MGNRLFQALSIEEAEETPVQYVGVYLLRWGKVVDPEIAFVETEYTVEYVQELLEACEAAGNFIAGLALHHPHLFPEDLDKQLGEAMRDNE